MATPREVSICTLQRVLSALSPVELNEMGIITSPVDGLYSVRFLGWRPVAEVKRMWQQDSHRKWDDVLLKSLDLGFQGPQFMLEIEADIVELDGELKMVLSFGE